MSAAITAASLLATQLYKAADESRPAYIAAAEMVESLIAEVKEQQQLLNASAQRETRVSADLLKATDALDRAGYTLAPGAAAWKPPLGDAGDSRDLPLTDALAWLKSCADSVAVTKETRACATLLFSKFRFRGGVPILWAHSPDAEPVTPESITKAAATIAAREHGDGCICEPCNEARADATAELNRRRRGKHDPLGKMNGPSPRVYPKATWCVGCGHYCGSFAVPTGSGCGFAYCKSLSSRPQPWRYFAEFPQPEVTS
jgi:hypothetical protein